MRETLSVIVPYYNEARREIFPMLASLDGQAGVDFGDVEIILVSDGGLAYPQEFLALFANLNLRTIIMKENGGPGAARQAGIDAAGGEYVMFCDADDTLHNALVLRTFVNFIRQQRTDMFGAPWYIEHFDQNTSSFSYELCDNDHTWLHGKAFRRGFLLERGIRFHERLRICEDSYFLALVAAEAHDPRRIGVISYIWKYRPNSLTRRGGDSAVYDSAPERVKAFAYIFAEIEKRRPEKLPLFVTDFVMLYHFLFKKPEWQLPENAPRREKAEAAFREVMRTYGKHYYDAPRALVGEVYERHRALQGERREVTP